MNLDKAIVLDCEVFPNYFLLALKGFGPKRDETLALEMQGSDTVWDDNERTVVRKLLEGFTTYGFNSLHYDLPIIAQAIIEGHSCKTLWKTSQALIKNGERPFEFLSKPAFQWKARLHHFDLKEVAPGIKMGLKNYGGTMHTQSLQDLPYDPETELTPEQMDRVKSYCVNDLNITRELFGRLRKEMDLRLRMSRQYKKNLMSKSDAQIAEVLIRSEIEKSKGGCKLVSPKVNPGHTFYYTAPNFVFFQTPDLQSLKERLEAIPLSIGKTGHVVENTGQLKNMTVKINRSVYSMGLGGLHSTEKSVVVRKDDDTVLVDADVTSYYPYLILNQNLYPTHLGKDFLRVYKDIVETRVRAKADGDKTTADSLKIVVNGAYGKLGSSHSILYAPDNMIQVTLTGQLIILMLIENMETRGIEVASANTDGILCRVRKPLLKTYENICSKWEEQTGFNLEFTYLDALYSRDINNYMARNLKGEFYKGKGIFKPPALDKNPWAEIFMEAVQKYLSDDIPIRDTIRSNENDVTKYLFVRSVKGGGTWKGEYLGRVVRWVWSKDGDMIVGKTTGNKVADSDGCRPVMNLDDFDPDWLDHDRYEQEAEAILSGIGCKSSNRLF